MEKRGHGCICLYAHKIALEDYLKNYLQFLEKRGPETRGQGWNEDFLLHNFFNPHRGHA